MSLLKYFKKSEKASAWDPYKVCESIKNDWPDNITANELEKVQECLKVPQEENKKRTVYAEKDKQEIESMRQFVELQRHQKILTKVPKLNRKHLASMGKKLQKISSRRRREVDHCV